MDGEPPSPLRASGIEPFRKHNRHTGRLARLLVDRLGELGLGSECQQSSRRTGPVAVFPWEGEASKVDENSEASIFVPGFHI